MYQGNRGTYYTPYGGSASQNRGHASYYPMGQQYYPPQQQRAHYNGYPGPHHPHQQQQQQHQYTHQPYSYRSEHHQQRQQQRQQQQQQTYGQPRYETGRLSQNAPTYTSSSRSSALTTPFVPASASRQAVNSQRSDAGHVREEASVASASAPVTATSMPSELSAHHARAKTQSPLPAAPQPAAIKRPPPPRGKPRINHELNLTYQNPAASGIIEIVDLVDKMYLKRIKQNCGDSAQIEARKSLHIPSESVAGQRRRHLQSLPRFIQTSKSNDQPNAKVAKAKAITAAAAAAAAASKVKSDQMGKKKKSKYQEESSSDEDEEDADEDDNSDSDSDSDSDSGDESSEEYAKGRAKRRGGKTAVTTRSRLKRNLSVTPPPARKLMRNQTDDDAAQSRVRQSPPVSKPKKRLIRPARTLLLDSDNSADDSPRPKSQTKAQAATASATTAKRRSHNENHSSGDELVSDDSDIELILSTASYPARQSVPTSPVVHQVINTQQKKQHDTPAPRFTKIPKITVPQSPLSDKDLASDISISVSPIESDFGDRLDVLPQLGVNNDTKSLKSVSQDSLRPAAVRARPSKISPAMANHLAMLTQPHYEIQQKLAAIEKLMGGYSTHDKMKLMIRHMEWTESLSEKLKAKRRNYWEGLQLLMEDAIRDRKPEEKAAIHELFNKIRVIEESYGMLLIN
ncbi:hypothetical protein GQ42DRAFT_1167 [Ramicandelaber brevisporus]|nr:hypothetical protein GQ42DRAFT_1167 [Ramicandelaber brevisporus]